MSTKSNNKATFVWDFLYNAHRSVKFDDGKNVHQIDGLFSYPSSILLADLKMEKN